jgi:hypothetical protein
MSMAAIVYLQHGPFAMSALYKMTNRGMKKPDFIFCAEEWLWNQLCTLQIVGPSVRTAPR